jgi:hypothetical protein
VEKINRARHANPPSPSKSTYGGTSDLNLKHPNLDQIQVKHFVLQPPKTPNIVTSNTKNGVVGLEFCMNIMFRITENETSMSNLVHRRSNISSLCEEQQK